MQTLALPLAACALPLSPYNILPAPAPTAPPPRFAISLDFYVHHTASGCRHMRPFPSHVSRPPACMLCSQQDLPYPYILIMLSCSKDLSACGDDHISPTYRTRALSLVLSSRPSCGCVTASRYSLFHHCSLRTLSCLASLLPFLLPKSHCTASGYPTSLRSSARQHCAWRQPSVDVSPCSPFPSPSATLQSRASARIW